MYVRVDRERAAQRNRLEQARAKARGERFLDSGLTGVELAEFHARQREEFLQRESARRTA
jgi:hypothetical protein